MANLYIVIRSGCQYYGTQDLIAISQAMLAVPDLEQVGSHRWELSGGATPWCIMEALNCNAKGSYTAESPQDINRANLIQVSAHTETSGESTLVLGIVARIAESLKWEYEVEDASYADLPSSQRWPAK